MLPDRLTLTEHCPSPELLRRSLDLDDPLHEAELRRIESHVDQCKRGCKELIETLLRGNTLAVGEGDTPAFETPRVLASERPTPAIPGYEIQEEIGRGGMGVVYKARHLQLNRLVALKMILTGVHAGVEDLARFRSEAEAVAALQHPNIVQIHEIGEQDGLPYFSLELVEGCSLSQKLYTSLPPPTWAAELVETLARAVHFSHQQGVIHRDLKPANVLLAADGTPKLVDFGLAKRLNAAAVQTGTGKVVGTPNYMAPEQVSREGAGRAGTLADVYGLGAVLYETLTGRPPFQAPTAWDVLMQVMSADPAPPRQGRTEVPADLETICLKCLRKDPQRRYGSAEALAADLRRFLTGRPIQARRVGVTERAVKWVRRNAIVATLLAGVIVATTGGGVGWLWRARERAERQGAALQKADFAMSQAEKSEEKAATIEQETNARGQEEPETPETAKRVVELLRSAESALDEAEQALTEGFGTDEAQARTTKQRRQVVKAKERAEKINVLLADLDRARASRAGTKTGGLDLDTPARLYRNALSGYDLDLSRPAVETAGQIRQAQPGVRLALILALDDLANYTRSGDRAEAERLGRIADEADDDPWRRRYRAALSDLGALKQLAGEAPALRLPAVSMIQLGRDLYTRGAREEAATLLRAVRRLYPRDFWVYFDLNNCLHDPDHPSQATLDEAESCACASVALRPDSAAAHTNMGNAFKARRDWEGAARCYRKANEVDPRFAPALNNLGNVLDDAGDWAAAIEAFKKAIEVDPKYGLSHCNLANVLFQRGNWVGAAERYRKAIEINPRHADAHSGLGSALYQQGDRKGAAECYRKAIEINARLTEAHYSLGLVLRDQGDRAAAAASYRKAIVIDPRYLSAHINLGSLLREQGDLPGAIEHARKATEIDSGSVFAWNNLGNALRDQGDLSGAVYAFRKAIEHDPSYVTGHTNLANTLHTQGNLVGAAASYKKAIEIDTKRPQSHFNFGLVLFDQGQFANAATSFRRCLDLLSEDAPLRAAARDNLQRCERLLALATKLPAILKGDQQPADNAERLGLAEVCEYQHRYAAAARFSRDAFAKDARLAEDLQSGARFAAAQDAVRAGCGLGEDAGELDDRQRASWRKQGLEWLRADLKLQGQLLVDGKKEDRKGVAEALRFWLKDTNLAEVRDAERLAKLPREEQETWGKLWTEVQFVLKKTEEKP